MTVAARPFSSPGQDDRYSALRDSVTGLSRRASRYQSGLSRIAHERASDPTVTPANRLSTIPARATMALLALALTGCATQTRYVSTYCISQDQYSKLKSAEPEKIGSKLSGKAQDDIKLIAGNDVELRTFSDGLLGVLQGCTEPPH